MNDQNPVPGGEAPRGSATWRQIVSTRVETDRAVLRDLGDDAGHPKIKQAVYGLLDRAQQATTERVGPIRWWRGTAQDAAYLALHEAEALLTTLLDDARLYAQARYAVTKSRGLLKRDDARVTAVVDALTAAQDGADPKKNARSDRIKVASLLSAVFAASDEDYAETRNFRNRLMWLMLFSAPFLLALVMAVGYGKFGLPRFTGISEIGMAGLLALSGAIGALITSVPPLAKAEGTWNPYSLPVYQMTLKVLLGPIFGIVGVLLIQTGFSEMKPISTALPLMVWALAFGASQQAVTQIIDKKVSGLISSDKPKDDTKVTQHMVADFTAKSLAVEKSLMVPEMNASAVAAISDGNGHKEIDLKLFTHLNI